MLSNGTTAATDIDSEMVWGEASSSSDESSTSEAEDNGSVKTYHSPELAKKETAAVNLSKTVVYLVLILATAALATVTYVIAIREEERNFERGFVDVAFDFASAANHNSEDIMGQLQSLSTSYTSSAIMYNWTWPFVTLPNFGIRSFNRRDTSGIETIVFAPIVRGEDVADWEVYAWENQLWINLDLNQTEPNRTEHPGFISPFVWDWKPETERRRRDLQTADENNFSVPVWQISPLPPSASIINLDLRSIPFFERLILDVMETHHAVLSEAVTGERFLSNGTSPRSFVFQPVFDDFSDVADVVGFVQAITPWEAFFSDTLPGDTPAIIVDVVDSCGNSFTYVVQGRKAVYQQDPAVPKLRHAKYDYLRQTFPFATAGRYDGVDHESTGHCEFNFTVAPTLAFEATFRTDRPDSISAVVFFVFMIQIVVFAIYDCKVQHRNRLVLGKAKQTTAIVSSLFPQQVHERMLLEAEQNAKAKGRISAKSRLKEFLNEGDAEKAESYSGTIPKTKPIADFFPEVTVMFGDLVGFTAWSSLHEPTQVFTLLETVYASFDEIAARRRVFKVETVGDCYVAVAGLPEPRKDHAVVMARFARDCLNDVNRLVKKLATTLGPDTTELAMRFGLHSGPVTAGVLRGERSRFQLFGDSMNTTARIETTGKPGKIHISSDMAGYLVKAGKNHWIQKREDKVVAKGKGELDTYWLDVRSENIIQSATSVASTSNGSNQQGTESGSRENEMNGSDGEALGWTNELQNAQISVPVARDKTNRLVSWIKDAMVSILKDIASMRRQRRVVPDSESKMREVERVKQERHTVSMDEVEDCIDFPLFDEDAFRSSVAIAIGTKLDDKVVEQLHYFVQTIAEMYNDQNAFHSFEHIAHVTMSVVKLFSRVVAPDLGLTRGSHSSLSRFENNSFGVTFDPMTRFAVYFSALIHDVDHPGVPNSQLVKEQMPMAKYYSNKSIAEQNSLDLAWDLLMHEGFEDLRRAIYCNEEEFFRFRKLVVNAVLATDLLDGEIASVRKQRWSKAFMEEFSEDTRSVSHRVTLVVEHLIQASDIAHTMQHWHIYRKWNEKLFQEFYAAWRNGRLEQNPADFWYKGEIEFYDTCVIPLAMKLKECGVFGASSDEYFNYAENNRREWVLRGESVVQEMVESLTSGQ